jgi:3-phenylpropionate/trans-cinnamate dioxygenase ferredoxin subunit
VAKEYLVGKLDDIPDGRSVAISAGRRVVAVFRLGREVFALANTCPHRGASLCEGKILTKEKVVRCPWHHWNWHLDSGALDVDPQQKLRTYEVAIEGDDVIVRV